MEILWDIRSQLWLLVRSLLQIIDWLGQAFKFLVGADMTDASGNGGTGSNVNNLFENIFNGGAGEDGSWSMTDIYLHILFFSVILLGVCLAIGAIKAQFSKGATDSLATMGEKSLFAFVKMLAIPVVFLVALQAIGFIFNYLIGVMVEATGAGNSSIAQMLCDACTMGEDKVYFDDNYDKTKITFENFNFVLCILSSAFLVITLVMVSINLVKRIIEIFFYYLTAPISLAKTPLDDGKSFDLWKENVIAKLFSAGGIIICMYLYYMIIPIFTATVQTWVTSGDGLLDTGSRGVVGCVLTILFILGGSTVPANASMMVAQLISQGAGQNESNNLMHTQSMVNSGLQLGAKVAMGGFGAAAASVFFKGKGSNPFGGGKSGLAANVASSFRANNTAKTQKRDSTAAFGNTSSPAEGNEGAAFNNSNSGNEATQANVYSASRENLNADTSNSYNAGAQPSYLSQVGSALKNNWHKAGTVLNSSSEYHGISGKVGAGVAALGTLVGGTLMAPIIPLIKKGGLAAGRAVKSAAIKTSTALRGGNSRIEGRKVKRTIKAENNQAKKEAKRAAKEEKRNTSILDSTAANNGDVRGLIDSKQEFLNTKTDSLEKKINSVERIIDKKTDWSDEQKERYREARYGREAAEYMGYKDKLQGSGVDTKRYDSMFEKLQNSLPKKENKDNGGEEA